MHIILVFLALFVITFIVSIPFSYIHMIDENYIRKVQSSNMVINTKSLISSLLLSIIMVSSLWYGIIKPNRPSSDAFYLGLIMTAYSELTTSLMFTNWPLQIAFLDTIVGGIIFGSVAFIYKLIFKNR